MSDVSKRLKDLDRALADLGDQTMTLSQIDGLFAGLAVCPDLIPPSEWLSKVWGDVADEPVFENADQAQLVLKLLMGHYNDIIDTLQRRPGHYAPIFDVYEPTDETFWEFWVEGFETAMRFRPDAWLPIADDAGEANDALCLLITLAGLAMDDPEVELEPAAAAQLKDTAPDIIPECVLILAARRFGVAPRAGAKVGRNDPCPCGSGKKHKKCCGAH